VAKEAVFKLTLESDLREAFLAEAAAMDRPAAEVVRDLMREFVERQRRAREYETFLEQKVAQARRSMETGTGRLDAEVAADFATRRTNGQ